MRYVVYISEHPALPWRRFGAFRWRWFAELIAAVYECLPSRLWPMSSVVEERS